LQNKKRNSRNNKLHKKSNGKNIQTLKSYRKRELKTEINESERRQIKKRGGQK
jgi:hypothetical protein